MQSGTLLVRRNPTKRQPLRGIPSYSIIFCCIQSKMHEDSSQEKGNMHLSQYHVLAKENPQDDYYL